MVLYKKIADDIRSKILNGEYNHENPLPEQIKLADLYKTSRVTIQKSMDILKSEGLIFSKRGSGTFVKKNADTLSLLDNQIDVYEGVTATFGNNKSITSKILKFSIRLPKDIEVEKLFLSKNSAVYDILRLRLIDEEPFIIEHTIMPVEVIPGISEEILYESIYSHIKDTLNLNITLADRRIRADKPNSFDQTYLDCEITDPILEVEQVAFLSTGVPFEYSKTRRRYDKGDIVMIQTNKTI